MASIMRPLVAPPPDGASSAGSVPTFSVVIAAYQVATLIPDALDSALAQTVPPHEILVCDDGSTDDLDAALAPYRDRITLIRQENRGEGAAKNAASRKATGDFLVFLDADDVYLPERIEALGDAAVARPDLDILVTDAFVELDGATIRHAYDEAWPFEIVDQRRAILERCFVIGQSAVRRDRFFERGAFDDSMRIMADWDLWLRMILGGSRAGLIDAPLARYRIRAGSLSTNRVGILAGGLRCLERAAARDDLGDDERRTVAKSIAKWRADLRLAEVRAALLEESPGIRRHLWQIVVGPGYSLRTRAKCAVAMIAPGRARAQYAERAAWEGAAGVRVGQE